MLTVTRISPGAGYRYLTEQVAAGRHDLQAAVQQGPASVYAGHAAQGEARGWWVGAGAADLGMRGAVTETQMKNLIGAGRHPATGQVLGRNWKMYQPQTDAVRLAAVNKALGRLPDDATVEQRDKVWHDIMTAPEKRAISGYDVTVSPVKSVSLLWAFGDDDVKADVMAAHHAGVRAMVGHLERHGAFTRTGAGGLQQVDTAGLAITVFDHRMSREKDPQVHSHVVVSAKVRTLGRDGEPTWLALDGKALYQATIGGRLAYERALEGELGRRRGVRFAAREGSTIREIVGISGASLRHYSKRREAVETEMRDRTVQPGVTAQRVPASIWRRRAQDATLRTRAPQSGPESTREAVGRWHREDAQGALSTVAQVERVLAGRAVDEVGRLATRVLRRTYGLARDRDAVTEADLHTTAAQLGVTEARRDQVVDAAVRLDPRLAVQRAVRELSTQRAVFNHEHLEAAIGRNLHIDLADSPGQDWARVQRLAQRVIAEGVGGLRVLNPPALVRWGPSLQRVADSEAVYTRHRDLSMTTRAVLAAEKEVIAYGARRGATPAPPRVVNAVAEQMQLSAEKAAALRFAAGDDRRITAVIGPAGSGKTYMQRAVAAVAQRAGIPVLGLTVGQSAAQLLRDATAQPDGTRMRTENIAMWLHAQNRPPQDTTTADWTFQQGQWVIVDEASQVSSLDLARLVKMLDAVGGKLILVGDPAQVSAVGPGGLLRYLHGLGNGAELSEAHRFTQAWEGPASLRLRAADVTVLADYDRRGRITGGHREQLITQMIDGWAADILAGRRTLMLVTTQAEATSIAARARERLIRAGRVDTRRQIRLADDNHAGVGDIIVTRRNDRTLTAAGAFVANRDQWSVTNIGPAGQLHVTNVRTGHAQVLPADYAAHHVQLAYASTVDAAQGQTVQTARSLIDDAVTHARLYVMLTRGETLNQAYVVTDDEPAEGTPPQPPGASVEVLADILRRVSPERSATETAHQLWADVDALYAWAPIYDDLNARAQAGRYLALITAARSPTGVDLDTAAGTGLAERLAGDPALPALVSRLQTLERAGYDPAQVLQRVIRPRELDSADDAAAVLSWRIDRVLGTVTADPRAATTAGSSASFTARLPATLPAGDIADALRQVAQICDQRVTALTDLAAERQPAWAHALGPVPDDLAGHRQWEAVARLVVTYRDRYRVTGDDPIGAEPAPQAVDRWQAWHRARVALGTATLAGRIAAADNPDLARLVAAQRSADAAAPAYVATRLRTAHVDLVSAEHRVTDLGGLLTDTRSRHTQASRQAAGTAPRWWQWGPSRARAVQRQQLAQQRLHQATSDVAAVRSDLSQARGDASRYRTTVTDLESQHQTWTRWYDAALPTRYAGLAAAAEQSRRLTNKVRGVSRAVAETTARVRAIDDTRPQPHARPPATDLTTQADDARERFNEPAPEDPTDPFYTPDHEPDVEP